MRINIVIFLILAIVLVIFTLQNSTGITINVLFWKFYNAPLPLILIVTLLMGYILAGTQLYPKIWRYKKEIKKLAKSEVEADKPDLTEEDKNDPEGIELPADNREEDNSFFN